MMLPKLATAAAVSAFVVILVAGGAVAQTTNGAPTVVVAIYQTAHITEHQRFTVSAEVGSTTGIQFVYFTFCQLSSPQCYRPVAMALHAPNWYVGTTNPMSTYPGMLPGVKAGYNITVEYTDNHTVAYPAFPNAFSNLTVGTEVGSGWFMFEMTVSNLTFNLTGTVQDSATSMALSGAHVTLTPGNGTTVTTGATGGYSFGSVENGTYSLVVARPGYTTTTQTVSIAGHDTVANVPMANASIPPGSHSAGKGGLSGFLTSSIGGVPAWVIVGAALVAVVVVVGVAFMRRRTRPSSPTDDRSGSGPPSSGPPT